MVDLIVSDVTWRNMGKSVGEEEGLPLATVDIARDPPAR